MKTKFAALRDHIDSKNVEAVALMLGFGTPFVPLRDGPLAGIWGVQGFAYSASTRMYVVEIPIEPLTRLRLVKAMYSHAPLDSTLWWFAGNGRFSVAVGGDTPIVRSLIVGDNVSPAALQQVERLAVGGPARPDRSLTESTHEHWARVMETEPLTREFFKRFSEILRLMVRELSYGPADPQQCHDVALINLLRLVFVYFLQRRGALGDEREFILQRWLKHGGDFSFYQRTLRPLFFGLLNTPYGQRSAAASRLGDVPFLNGGLFERTPVERRYPQLDWGDWVWSEVIEVFERYPFALRGADANESVRAIDPEMLGKVFEGLMYGDRRADSGSFYTPRDVVEDLVRQAVVPQVAAIASMPTDRLEALVSSSSLVLRVEERTALRAALAQFTVLDPACGTGAFLLSAMRLLARLWSMIEGRPVDHVMLREVIHKHIFGVDVEQTAVRLCELRLWLEILAATPKMSGGQLPPLPNLGHRIVAGNALVEHLDFAQPGDPACDSEWVRQAAYEITALQRAWIVAHGAGKRVVQAKLDLARYRMQVHLLDAQEEHLGQKRSSLTNASISRDLFGSGESNAKRYRLDLGAIDIELERLGALRIELEDARSSGVAFSFATAFPDVDGFDVIVTNPPWVRSHRLDVATRRLLGRRYRSTSSTLWAGAAARGIKAPFGAQVDLANVFVERSLELLRPGGRLAALVPAKMFRSLQGTALRRVLQDVTVVSIEDFSEASRNLFDATTYPAAISLFKGIDSQIQTNLAIWDGEDKRQYRTDSHRFRTSAPWPLMNPSVAGIFATMEAAHGGLNLCPERGVFTGRNAVFVRTREAWEQVFESQEQIRPVLSGRDPMGRERCIFWAYDSHGKLTDVDPAVEPYFEANRRQLEARADHRHDLPLWQLFRVRPKMTGPKVVWRDMSEFLEAYVAPAGGVPLNTLYYLPCETVVQARVLAAVLTSVPVRAFARAYGERARGGWRRHFAWLLRMLPVPQIIWDWVDQEHVPVPAEIAACYGLTAGEVDCLAAWMGVEALPERRSA